MPAGKKEKGETRQRRDGCSVSRGASVMKRPIHRKHSRHNGKTSNVEYTLFESEPLSAGSLACSSPLPDAAAPSGNMASTNYLPPVASEARGACRSIAPPNLLTAREAAKALTLCERTLWQKTKDGEIPVV